MLCFLKSFCSVSSPLVLISYKLGLFGALKLVMLTLVLQFLLKLGLFGMLKLALALQFIVTNAYFSVARMLTLVLHVH